MIFVALFVLIFILYIPWIPTVFALGKTKSFWIHKPANNFFVSYFWDYFGGDPFSVYTFAFLLLFFLSGTAWYSNRVASDSLLQDRYSSSVLILLTWTFVTYLIPYVKSLVSVPLLFNRYTIVTLPALLVAAAIAVDLMRRNLMKVYFVMLVVIFSVIHLFFYDQYYETRTKTQWRELSAFVVRNNANKIPLISDREWQLRYYFGLANYHPTYVSQDSLPNLNKVWVVSVHQGHPVTELNKEILAREFKSRRSFSGIGASANLYIRQKMTIILKSANRQKDGYYAMYDNGQLTSAPVHLKQGKYRLAVYGFGTSAQGEYPSVAVSVNGKVVNLFTLQGERDYTFALEQAEDADVVFALQFTNDASIDGEDRNVFIKFFDLQRIYPQRGAKRLREESTR